MSDTTREQNWLPLLIIAAVAAALGLVFGLAVGEFANSQSRRAAEERLTTLEEELASAKSERTQLESQRAEQQQEIERLREQSVVTAAAAKDGINPERVARLEDRVAQLSEQNEALRKKLRQADEIARETSDSSPPLDGEPSSSAVSGGQVGLTIANTTVKNQGFGITTLVGEVTNNTSRRYSATLMATFYGKDGCRSVRSETEFKRSRP
ncbi:MAG: hypothetical protein WD738_09565 [Pirellulales bacterium]